MKTNPIKYRTHLLTCIMEQNYSLNIKEKILEIIANTEENKREELAKTILQIVKESPMEEEVVNNLQRVGLL